jgi:hypothetical protein
MRYGWLLIPLVVVACAKGEQAQENAEEAAPAAAALTDAAVAGTWTGVGMPVGSDSVVAQWTQVCGNGSCVGTYEGNADTSRSTYTIDGDSVIGTSTPYASVMAGGAMVTDSWVVHPMGDSATGTGTIRLADMPDSVLLRYHVQGSRNPGM